MWVSSEFAMAVRQGSMDGGHYHRGNPVSAPLLRYPHRYVLAARDSGMLVKRQLEKQTKVSRVPKRGPGPSSGEGKEAGMSKVKAWQTLLVALVVWLFA